MPSRFHQQQYLIVGGLAAFFALLYFFAASEKAAAFLAAMTTCVGFVGGKFSNGFKGGYQAPAKPAKDESKEEEKADA